MAGEKRYQICAVDGGGTGCRVAVADRDGAVLARASGGPANYATDSAQAVGNLLDAVRRAVAELGGDASTLRCLAAHVGVAGILGDADARDMASRLPFARCTVSDDRVTSLAGALGAADGVLLAIGTGSFAAMRRGGAVRLVGGWGLNLGDQASGARLGRDLLENTLLAGDGLLAETDLTRAVLARFGGTPAGLVAFAARARPSDYAELAPLVIGAADAGDGVARALMERGARYLNGVLAAAGLSGDDVVCLSGGIGPRYETFLAPEFRARLRPPEGTALDGALRLALRARHDLEAPA